MEILTVLDGQTQVGVLHNETQRFSTPNGPVMLAATDRDIVVSFRSSGKGTLWIGAWRYMLAPLDADSIGLHTDMKFSDSLCRIAREDPQASPVHCYAGQAVVDPNNEVLLHSRTEGVYVVTRKWLSRKARKARR